MNSQRFRYWMARFRPIMAPQVWMPLLGTGLVSSFVWVAYQSPESLSLSGGRETAAETDDSAIGADIDSVSVLMQEMGDRREDGEVNPESQTSATRLKPGAIAKSEGERGSSSLAQLVKFTPDADRPIAGTPGADGLNAGTTPTDLLTRTRNNDGSAPRVSALAQAIDRMNAQPYSNQSGLNPVENRGVVPIEGTGFIGNGRAWTGIPVGGTAGLTTTAPPIDNAGSRTEGGASYGNNAYTNLTGAPSGYSLPDAGIATPIAPVGVPIAPTTGFNSGMVTPLSGVNTGETVNVPSEQVFSVPRPVPGRIIGGGTINTFSNP